MDYGDRLSDKQTKKTLEILSKLYRDVVDELPAAEFKKITELTKQLEQMDSPMIIDVLNLLRAPDITEAVNRLT